MKDYFSLAHFKMVPAVCAYCGAALGTVSDMSNATKRCSKCHKATIFVKGEVAGWK